MGVHTASTTYAVQQAQIAAANSTRVSAEATAQTTLAAALSTAQAAYKPNDGGAFTKAIASAYATYDAAVASARATNDAVAAVEAQQQKAAIRLP